MGYVALAFCAVFTIWLLRRDVALRGPMPRALWIPLCWMLIYSTRPVTRWLGIGKAGQDVDGAPADALVVGLLIVAAWVVLKRRGFEWSRLAVLNVGFFALLMYFAVSISWTPLPFVAVKRWLKEFGHVLVILVILTDRSPAAAIRLLGVRCATILFPLSVVLARWFPAFGRQYGNSGVGMITGVTMQKNTLGEICCLYGLVLVWDLLETVRERERGVVGQAMAPRLIVLAIGMWLLLQSQSKTSLVAFLVGLSVFFCTHASRGRGAAPGLGRAIFVAVVIGVLITSVWSSVMTPVFELLGRDETFTERTKIWDAVLREDINPVIGTGFFSFWLERGTSVWGEFYAFRMRTAHCGYLEMYLDGGWIGSVLLGAWLLATGWRTAGSLSHTNTFSRFVFAAAMIALVVNISETCFFRLGVVWFFLVLASLGSHASIFARAGASEGSEAGLDRGALVPGRLVGYEAPLRGGVRT